MYKLLIVDDEPDIVNLLKDFFEMNPCWLMYVNTWYTINT